MMIHTIRQSLPFLPAIHCAMVLVRHEFGPGPKNYCRPGSVFS